jgi:multidrug efflux pump subunit AcrA (membrane-fusion protein)
VEVTLVGVESLASGLVATVEIQPRTDTAVALVPVEALLEAQGDEATVYSVSADGQRAERHAVKVAFMAGERVALRAGLEGVAAAITAGAAKLDAGDRVEVAR